MVKKGDHTTNDIDNVEDKFLVLYRFIGLQTSTQDESDENTDADIIYDHFVVYYNDAIDELVNILAVRNIVLTENQENTALCHLIADYHEMGNPDWSFRSQSQAPGVSFSRGEKTGPRMALEKMLDNVELANRRNIVTSGRGASMTFNRIKDATNYPMRWKRTSIPGYDQSEDGFDSSPVSDLGTDDNQNNAW